MSTTLGLGVSQNNFAGYYRIKIYNQSNPKIEKYEWNGEETKIEVESTDIAFRLLDITHKERESEIHGKKTEVYFTIDLGDDQPSRLKMNLNNMTKSILNSLASVEDLFNKLVSLRVYTSKSGYASVWVEVDGERAEWRFTVDQIKKMKKDESWTKMIDTLLAPQFDVAPDTIEGPEGMELIAETESVNEEEEEDDLPF